MFIIYLGLVDPLLTIKLSSIGGGHRKGLSLIVSTLLMISVAVACSTVTYFWVTSTIRFQSQRAQTEIRIEYVSWIDNRSFVIGVRNMGISSVTLESVSIKKNQSGEVADESSLTVTLSAGAVAELQGTLSTFTLENNVSYLVRVTTTTGFYYEVASISSFAY